MRVLGRALLGTALVSLLGWIGLAVFYSPLPWAWVRTAAALLAPLGGVAALIAVRPRRRAVAGVLGAFVVVLVAWLAIPPSNTRDWQPDVAVPAYADIRGDRVTVHNVRNNEYRTEADYTVRLEARGFELSRLRTLDLFLVYWGSPAIAHTIMSWGFDDGRYLAISIETRKKKGEQYSAVRGFFRQYELFYVVADERDVVGLRTNYRNEDVYLYRLDASPDMARKLLLSYLTTINRLRDTPEWYNALTQNCTTTIRGHAAPFARRSWWSWKIFLNGYVDELAYEKGAVDRSLPFPILKTRSHINERAKAAAAAPDFSERIRVGLPWMGDHGTPGAVARASEGA